MPISSAYAPTWPPQEPQLSPNAIKHRDLIIAGEGQSVVIDDWSMLTGARRVTTNARGATTLIVDDTAAKKVRRATRWPSTMAGWYMVQHAEAEVRPNNSPLNQPVSEFAATS